MKLILLIGLLGVFIMNRASQETKLPSTAGVATEVAVNETMATEFSPVSFPVESQSGPEGAIKPTPAPEPARLPLPGIEVLTFAGDEPGWYTVDDNVMGGVSRSSVQVIDPGLLFFSGTMSLENNGGFSSVRSDWTPTDLSGSDGLLLRVLGDGNTYRLRIRSTETGRGISYNALFETTPGAWKVVYIPFADMIPTYRGYLMDVGPLDPTTIGSFGFMLSDKQPGEFGLLVDWIRAVSEEELRAPHL